MGSEKGCEKEWKRGERDQKVKKEKQIYINSRHRKLYKERGRKHISYINSISGTEIHTCTPNKSINDNRHSKLQKERGREQII